MKTSIYIMFFFLLATQICFAQWYQQNSSTTKNLYSVHFVDENNGWVVGDSGTILKTTNLGNNWIMQTSGTVQNLYDVQFVDDNNGWVVGDSGKILRTTNGGTNWFPQVSDTTLPLNAVFFIDENIGWVVGGEYYGIGVILKTIDGGANWICQLDSAILALHDVYFVDVNLGFVAGGALSMEDSDGKILKTTDSGENWSIQMEVTRTYWKGISFSDALNGVAVGAGGILLGGTGEIRRTTDGGLNWLLAYGGGGYINSVEIIDTNYIWAVGAWEWWVTDNPILYSSDRGVNWLVQGEFSNNLNSVCFINSSTGWVVGDSGTILHTTNGGIPVELTSFTAATNGKEVIINWSTATELNNRGFEIQRRTEKAEFLTVGFVEGYGTTTEQQNYNYTDKNLNNGKYYYRLKQVDYNGSYEYSDVVEVKMIAFNSYLLAQNFPNPFNPTTTIGFGIQNRSNVKITVLNVIGEEVAVLLNEEKEAGYHQVEFNGTNLPSGVYIYRLQAEAFTRAKKMILLK